MSYNFRVVLNLHKMPTYVKMAYDFFSRVPNDRREGVNGKSLIIAHK